MYIFSEDVPRSAKKRQTVLNLLNFILVVITVLRILCWALVFVLQGSFDGKRNSRELYKSSGCGSGNTRR